MKTHYFNRTLGTMERKNALYSSMSGPIHVFKLEESYHNFLLYASPVRLVNENGISLASDICRSYFSRFYANAY